MQRILKRVYKSKRTVLSLKIISHICTAVGAEVFCLQLLLLLLNADYFTALGVCASAAVGLVIVTAVRKLINAPRPYEIYGFCEERPHQKNGQSFPSRHAYSAFVIAVLSWLLHPVVAILLFVSAACLSATRVLLGIHFLRDVLVGAATGMLAGVLGILIIIL